MSRKKNVTNRTVSFFELSALVLISYSGYSAFVWWDRISILGIDECGSSQRCVANKNGYHRSLYNERFGRNKHWFLCNISVHPASSVLNQMGLNPQTSQMYQDDISRTRMKSGLLSTYSKKTCPDLTTLPLG